MVGTKPAQAAFPGENGKIAFTSYLDGGGNWDVYVMDADGQNRTRLTDNPTDDYAPAFSPDGTKIAFTRSSYQHTSGSDWDVYVMDADGQNQTNLSNESGAFDFDPTFSPDGKRIAFARQQDGNREVYVMDADGQNPTTSPTPRRCSRTIPSSRRTAKR